MSLYLDSLKKRLLSYKELAGKTFALLNDEQLHWQPAGKPNNIYIIVKHMSGNIRTEPHTVIDALNRQLAHYPYHVGQIVYLGKVMKAENWQSLSIPKGGSQQFNEQKASGK